MIIYQNKTIHQGGLPRSLQDSTKNITYKKVLHSTTLITNRLNNILTEEKQNTISQFDNQNIKKIKSKESKTDIKKIIFLIIQFQKIAIKI